MKNILFTLVILLLLPIAVAAQGFTENLYNSYEKYKEPRLDKRRIKHEDIVPLINKLKAKSAYTVQQVGQSIEGRSLNLISLGKGKTDIFLWSQMHGDEPTATMAIFDIFNFFNSPGLEKEKRTILAKTRLHFLPMLNPDGAALFTRRNALGIDINRDALRLQSPEGRTLKRIRDSTAAVFGFNLHDQSRYYNAKGTSKPATISYLATAYNYEKDINKVRERAMKTIVYMNDVIQKYAPGQVGRYNDDFEPRAFGDNIAKWGTSLILIESGGYANDREKQHIRKLNFVSILSALYGIATGDYKDRSVAGYNNIPRNDRKLFDLKIENLTYPLNGKDYTIDLGIQRQEIDDADHDSFYYKSVIVDQGDLSTHYGYQTFDARGYRVVAPKISDQIMPGSTTNFVQLTAYQNWLKGGYAFVRMRNIPREQQEHSSKINVVKHNYVLPKLQLKVGLSPNFFLEKDGKITHAIINGFLIDLSKDLDSQDFGNALIFR